MRLRALLRYSNTPTRVMAYLTLSTVRYALCPAIRSEAVIKEFSR
jgi:hypothetical protein